MWARAFWTVLPCGSSTAFFGVMIIFAFMCGGLPRKFFPEVRENKMRGPECFCKGKQGGQGMDGWTCSFSDCASRIFFGTTKHDKARQPWTKQVPKARTVVPSHELNVPKPARP